MNTKLEETTIHSHQPSGNDPSSLTTPPPSTSIPPTQQDHHQNTVPIDQTSSSTPPPSTSIPPMQQDHQNTVPIDQTSSSTPPPSTSSIPSTQQDHQNTIPIDQTSSSTPPPSTSIPPIQQDHQNTEPIDQTSSSSTSSIPSTQQDHQNTIPIDQTSSSTPPPSTSIPPMQQDHQNTIPIDQTTSSTPPPSTSSIPPTQQDHQNTVPFDQTSSSSTTQDKKTEKWGTHIMGLPAPPSSHPNNQKAAALWTAKEHNEPQQHPDVQNSSVDHKSSNNPIEPVIHVFNSWSTKADSLARNIWQNLKAGSSVSEAVYGKVGLTTKVLTGGGFEALYKQTFNVNDPNEKLKKTFACYLSTSTGPVAGTLYLTNIHVAFCSDRPLSFPEPSGQVAWSYYKVTTPLAKISSINPINMKENPVERYIQITTVDNHDFWFMGFVNYDKASLHLSQSSSELVAPIAHPV